MIPATPAELVQRHPQAARVLHRLGIEFCCRGGDLSLDAACAASGVTVDAVLAEINDAPEGSERHWDDAPLPELIEHILKQHHRPLDDELPRLAGLATKVRAAHPEAEDQLAAVESTLLEIIDDLHQHMPKEEMVLFPSILEGRGAMAAAPIAVMEEEHLRLGTLLAQLRGLTSDYAVPDGACRSWEALWHGLDALEADLHVHVHLEDHILFPRALRA